MWYVSWINYPFMINNGLTKRPTQLGGNFQIWGWISGVLQAQFYVAFGSAKVMERFRKFILSSFGCLCFVHVGASMAIEHTHL